MFGRSTNLWGGIAEYFSVSCIHETHVPSPCFLILSVSLHASMGWPVLSHSNHALGTKCDCDRACVGRSSTNMPSCWPGMFFPSYLLLYLPSTFRKDSWGLVMSQLDHMILWPKSLSQSQNEVIKSPGAAAGKGNGSVDVEFSCPQTQSVLLSSVPEVEDKDFTGFTLQECSYL